MTDRQTIATSVSIGVELVYWQLRSKLHHEVKDRSCVLFAKLTEHVKHILTTDKTAYTQRQLLASYDTA